MKQAAGRWATTHVLRLEPGDDVRTSLARWAADHDLAAGALVAAVGSLSLASIRPAGRQEPLLLQQDLEVISCSGTLSRDGLHVHVAVADAHGNLTAGHLLAGCIVRTTLELVIAELDGVTMTRTVDPATGYPELDPRRS